jgi:hypothetical protein
MFDHFVVNNSMRCKLLIPFKCHDFVLFTVDYCALFFALRSYLE